MMKKIAFTILSTAGLAMLLAAVPASAAACDGCGCQGKDKAGVGKDCGCKGDDKACECNQAKKDDAKVKTAPKAFDKKPAVGTKATCPVMGGELTVTKDTQFSEYKGKYYAFCCAGCKPQFDKEPAKFAK
jgi:YHS domain-containing protein